MPVDDARALRDELAKLLADLNESKTKSTSNLPEVIEVQVVGGKFKWAVHNLRFC